MFTFELNFCHFDDFFFRDEMTEKTIEDILMKDIRYHEGSKELMWIHGNVENGQTEIYSSIMQEKGDVIFAPLIADLVDNLEDSPPENVLQQTEELFLNIKLKVAFELCYHFSYIFNCFVLFEVYDKTKLSNAVMINLNSIVIESRFQNHFLVDCMCTLNGRRNLRYLLTLMTN